MKTRIFGGLGVVLSLILAAPVLAAPAPNRAEDSPLAAVPAKSPIVVQIQGFERTKLRLSAFLGNALPDLGPNLVKQMDAALKEIMGDRDLKVIPKDGRIFGVISSLDGITESPNFTVIVPVKGFNDFRDGFLTADERKSLKKTDDGYYSFKMDKTDETHYLVDRKSWVAVCMDKDNAKLFAGGDYAGLDTILTQDCSKAILGNDLTVYVNLKEINAKYGDQIKGLKALLDLGLGGAPGVDKKQIEMVKDMFNSFLQLLQDGEAFVLAVDLRPEGANLRMQVQFGKDTDTNGFLKELKTSPLKELGTLPNGQLSYSASNFDLSKSKTLSKMIQSNIADDENEDVKKAIEDAIKEMAAIGSRVDYSASDAFRGGLEVTETADPNKHSKAQLKLYQALRKTSTFATVPFKDKPKITENAETVGNFKFHKVTMSFDIEKAVQDLPEEGRAGAKAILVKTVGEGSSIWFGTDGKKNLQITAKDWLSAKEVLVAYLDGKKKLGDDEAFQSTRKQLPEDATGIMVADTTRFIETMMGVMKDALAGAPGGLPIQIPDIKAPKGKPSYFGMAMTLKNQHGSFDLFVPTSSVQQVRKMFAGLFDN